MAGPLFIGHGTQKLFGWFGGHGLDGTGGFFEQLGLRPGKRHATAAGAAETIGGALLVLGALTPVATTIISSTMVTAIRKVHAPKGPWATEGGYEYNVVLIAAMAALAENGPGPLSVDGALFPQLKGTGWAAFQLGAALAGSYLATLPPVNQAPAAAEQTEAASNGASTSGEPVAGGQPAR